MKQIFCYNKCKNELHGKYALTRFLRYFRGRGGGALLKYYVHIITCSFPFLERLYNSKLSLTLYLSEIHFMNYVIYLLVYQKLRLKNFKALFELKIH